MLYKIDEGLNIVDIINNYNVVIVLSTDMFYVRELVSIIQDNMVKGSSGANIEDFGDFGSFGGIIDTNIGFKGIGEFIANVSTPSLYGRHYYLCDYSGLSSVEVKKLGEYVKYSNSNGLLVVTVSKYQDFSKFLGSEYGTNNNVMVLHGYASNSVLKPLVKSYFNRNNISWDSEETLNMLMYQVGKYHNVYLELISRLDGYGGVLTYDLLKNELSDIQRTDVIDLLGLILENKGSSKVLRKNKIYKTLDILLGRYSLGSIIRMLRSYVGDLVKIRYIINNGTIPMLDNLDIEKVLVTLGDKLGGISKYKLSKYLKMIKGTSLVELLTIQCILDNIGDSDIGLYEGILGLINRYSLVGKN